MSKKPIVNAKISHLGDGRYMLDEDLIVRIAEVATEFRVPMGFPTDLTSVPKWLWFLVGHPATSEFIDAAIAHDWYCVRAVEEGNYSLRILGDSTFRYLLKESGVVFWKRVAMYYAVRLNGWCAFWGIKK